MTNLTKPWWESWAYYWMEEKHGIISTTGSGVQMMLIPVFSPMNGRSRLLSYHLSNSGSAAIVLLMWDAYLSDPSGFTTAGVRGGNNATTANGNGMGTSTNPIWQVQCPAGADVDAEALTRPYFQTGVTGQINNQPLFYSILLAHAALG
jgi:hypothetical protein